ncbi:MAG: hypothetical protein KBC12_03815 [Candidatus Pacebacteria bacterium]|nr:hypothetical protein [Candidatus Paceibacterota bacterium]
MKNSTAFLVLILIIIVGALFYFQKSKDANTNGETIVVSDGAIEGCYVATLAKDVYTLTILSEEAGNFTGSLSFKNFEKDSSSGTYNGTYKDGILLGDYSFQSEGMKSVMQVIFKKDGEAFVRGFGEVNETGDRFVNLDAITYDGSYKFEASTENCSVVSAS